MNTTIRSISTMETIAPWRRMPIARLGINVSLLNSSVVHSNLQRAKRNQGQSCIRDTKGVGSRRAQATVYGIGRILVDDIAVKS